MVSYDYLILLDMQDSTKFDVYSIFTYGSNGQPYDSESSLSLDRYTQRNVLKVWFLVPGTIRSRI